MRVLTNLLICRSVSCTRELNRQYAMELLYTIFQGFKCLKSEGRLSASCKTALNQFHLRHDSIQHVKWPPLAQKPTSEKSTTKTSLCFQNSELVTQLKEKQCSSVEEERSNGPHNQKTDQPSHSFDLGPSRQRYGDVSGWVAGQRK